MSNKMVRILTCLSMVFAIGCFVGVYGQQRPLATIRGPDPAIVSEAAGSVDVCINVTNANNIPAGGAEIVVFVVEQGADPATPGFDYRPQEQTLTFMPATASRCTSIVIIDDNIVEQRRETMVVRIRSTNTERIMVDGSENRDIVLIDIEDDDRLGLGFTQSQYRVQENIGSFELCTRIESGLIAPELMDISLEVNLIDGSSGDLMKNPNDNYVFSNTTSMIDCIPVTISDDNFVETNETFSVRLTGIGASSGFITFIRQDATIIIQDDDFATVTINPQQLTVAEGNDTMNNTLQLCVILSDIESGVEREVIVNISAAEETATGKDDFVLLNNSVTFPNNARQGDPACFQVLIIGDNFIETDEVFRVSLSTFFPDFVGNPSSATITVTRDGDAVCSILQSPVNGNVVLTGNTVGSVATYSCIANYTVVGPTTRQCTSDAGWTEQDSLCMRTCVDLAIQNGLVVTDLGQSIEGAIATYTCNPGHRLNNALNRVCQSNGQWNGTDPMCQAIDCGILSNPSNGFVIHLNGTLEGAVAIYTCRSGFQLMGDDLRMCDGSTRWLGSSPICSGARSLSSVGGMLLAGIIFMLTLSIHLL